MTDFSSRLKSLTAEPSRDTANDAARLGRVDRTRTELFGQGSAIRDTLAAAEPVLTTLAKALLGRSIDRIVIAGCGDSWFAGLGVRHAIEVMTGVPVESAQALEFAAYGVATSNTLAIGISSGGNTPAVMQALTRAKDGGAFCIGISNTPASPILTAFDAALMVHATRKGWPTQSTNATMALLVALGAAIAGASPARDAILAELSELPEVIDRLCSDLDAEMQGLAEQWAAADLVLFAGLGPNFAAASIGAAKLRELSPVHAFAIPLEEYHHYRSQKAGDPIVVVATDPASAERALDTALVADEVGGPLLAILSSSGHAEIERRAAATVLLPDVQTVLAAMVSIVPLHLLAFHFAKARAIRGLGAPRRADLS